MLLFLEKEEAKALMSLLSSTLKPDRLKQSVTDRSVVANGVSAPPPPPSKSKHRLVVGQKVAAHLPGQVKSSQNSELYTANRITGTSAPGHTSFFGS